MFGNQPREQPKFEFIYGNLLHVRVSEMAIFNGNALIVFAIDKKVCI